MRRDVILAAAILVAAFVVAGSSRYRPAAMCPAENLVCVVDGWTGKVRIRSPEGGRRELFRVLGEEWLEKDD